MNARPARYGLVALTLWLGCSDIKDSPPGTPDCGDSVGTAFSDSTYNFKPRNFACQGLPTSETFKLTESTFSVEGVSGSGAAGEEAAETWNAVRDSTGAAPQLALDVTTPLAGPAALPDNNSVIVMEDSISVVVGEVGYALQHVVDENNLTCDIIIYTSKMTSSGAGDPITWGTGSAAPPDGYRLQDVLKHELGHCVGFEHPDSGSHTDSIMHVWSTGASARTLSTTDESAYMYIY